LKQFSKVQKFSDFVSYSTKTNPVVSKILEDETNCFFSIHSIQELKNIKDKLRVIYLVQGWNFWEISFLIEEGINKFVVDNSQDLNILKAFLLKNDVGKISLFLRLKLKEHTLRTEKYFVFGFNSDFIKKEIIELNKLKKIDSVGIHFHRKTQNISEWGLKKELENLFPDSFFKNVNQIIIGGGLPGIYANTNIKIFGGIFEKIKEFKKWINSFGCKIIIEPGRFIAASSIKLETNIKAVYEGNVIVDASVYNSNLDALIVPVKLLVEGEVKKSEGVPYVIKGITPCSMDIFRYRVYFKEVPRIKDKITFLNAGAYNFRTDFCNLDRIKTEIVD